MADNLKDLVKSLILERCKLENDRTLDFAETNPLFIPIKNDQVSLSKEIESLEDADSCMLFFTYFRENTVPDRYIKGRWVTFRNPHRGFCYIDLQGKSWYSFNDDKFTIDGLSGDHCRLKIDDTVLMEVYVTEDSIKNLWNCYQIAKKCLQSQREEFENIKSGLEERIESLSNNYDKLKQRYETIVDSIDRIAQLTKTGEKTLNTMSGNHKHSL